MATYSEIGTNVNLSAMAGTINAQFAATRSNERGTTSPPVPVDGQFWVYDNGSTRTLRVRISGSFLDRIDLNHAQINAGGTIPMAANLDLGGNKITSLDDGVSADDAATVGQVAALLNGDATADRNMGGFKITGLGAATGTGHAARFDLTWQDSHACFTQIAGVTFHNGTTGFNACSGGRTTTSAAASTFAPRLLRLRLAGNITPVGGGALIGTLAGRGVEITANRWPDDTTGTWIEIGRVLSGVNECAVEVNWKNDTSGAGRGFSLRLRRLSDSGLYQAATAHAQALSGANFN